MTINIVIREIPNNPIDYDKEIDLLRKQAMELPIGYRFNLFLQIVDLIKKRDYNYNSW